MFIVLILFIFGGVLVCTEAISAYKELKMADKGLCKTWARS